eukprot:797688-Rhodomonas_salina.4
MGGAGGGDGELEAALVHAPLRQHLRVEVDLRLEPPPVRPDDDRLHVVHRPHRRVLRAADWSS